MVTEISFKKMRIENAMGLLRQAAFEGATHVTMRVRWEKKLVSSPPHSKGLRFPKHTEND